MLYKVLDTDGSCFHGGHGFWPLPEKRPDERTWHARQLRKYLLGETE
jgi:hypothetical protein